jgi:hypothetical protein
MNGKHGYDMSPANFHKAGLLKRNGARRRDIPERPRDGSVILFEVARAGRPPLKT